MPHDHASSLVESDHRSKLLVIRFHRLGTPYDRFKPAPTRTIPPLGCCSPYGTSVTAAIPQHLGFVPATRRQRIRKLVRVELVLPRQPTYDHWMLQDTISIPAFGRFFCSFLRFFCFAFMMLSPKSMSFRTFDIPVRHQPILPSHWPVSSLLIYHLQIPS